MAPIKKLTLILAIAFGLSLSYHLFVKKGLNQYHYHSVTKFNELFLEKGVQRDVLFLGSSVVHRGINPRVIDSICGINSYNAGLDGTSLFEFYYLLKSYLVNNPAPKCALLNLDAFSFRLDQHTFYFPLYVNYTSNPELANMISQRGYSAPVYKSMPFVVLSDLDDNSKGTFLKGIMGSNDMKPGDFHYKGYLSNGNETLKGDTTTRYYKVKVDTGSIQYLDKINALCKQKNIRLILNCAPIFREASFTVDQDINRSVTEMITAYAQKNNLDFLRGDLQSSLAHNPNYFANHGHLNVPGATAYSKWLAEQLNKVNILHLPNQNKPEMEDMAAAAPDLAVNR